MIDSTWVTLNNNKKVSISFQYTRNFSGYITGVLFMGFNTSDLTNEEQTEALNKLNEKV
jgi:hypothetical protein